MRKERRLPNGEYTARLTRLRVTRGRVSCLFIVDSPAEYAGRRVWRGARAHVPSGGFPQPARGVEYRYWIHFVESLQKATYGPDALPFDADTFDPSAYEGKTSRISTEKRQHGGGVDRVLDCLTPPNVTTIENREKTEVSLHD